MTDERQCANRKCLGGANCPGHPWREGELGELRSLEAASRDMNDAAYRGSGFRHARKFFEARAESAEQRAADAERMNDILEGERDKAEDARSEAFEEVTQKHDDLLREREKRVAAEQRVRELERELREAGERFQTLSACVEEDPRYLAIKRIAEQSEARLATAVEALTGTRNFLANVMRRLETGPPPSWADVKEALRQAEEGRARALSEIEQGDAK